MKKSHAMTWAELTKQLTSDEKDLFKSYVWQVRPQVLGHARREAHPSTPSSSLPLVETSFRMRAHKVVAACLGEAHPNWQRVRKQATRVVTALSLVAVGLYLGILSVTDVSRVLQSVQICTASHRGLMLSSSDVSVMSFMCFGDVDVCALRAVKVQSGTNGAPTSHPRA